MSETDLATDMKVFCGKCKHRRFVECAMGCTGNHCKSNPIPKYDSIHRWKQEEDCSVKNRNNDCREYESKKRGKHRRIENDRK